MRIVFLQRLLLLLSVSQLEQVGLISISFSFSIHQNVSVGVVVLTYFEQNTPKGLWKLIKSEFHLCF